MDSQTTTAPNAEVDAWAAKLDRLRNRKPLERVVTFHDEEAAEAAEQAREHLTRTERRVRSEVRANRRDSEEGVDDLEQEVSAHADVIAARAALVAAEQEQEAAAVAVRVRGLGSDIYVDLQAQYPPTAEQAKQGQEYDVSRFAPALVSACSVDDISVKQAAHLIGGQYPVVDVHGVETGQWKTVPASLNQGEASLLFTTCIGVNQGSRATLGKA